MTLHFFTKQETQDILAKLKEQFGIKEIPGIIVKIGQERLFLYQGSLNEKQIQEMEEEIVIERIGVYFAKEQNDGIRLSIEGAHLLKEQINKNIFEIDDNQIESWMKGQEILIDDIKKIGMDNDKLNKSDNKSFITLSINHKISGQSEPISGQVGGEKTTNQNYISRFVIIKHKNDLLGTGKASENKITNFIPKSRRLRERSY